MPIPYTVESGDTLSSNAQFGAGRYFGAVGRTLSRLVMP